MSKRESVYVKKSSQSTAGGNMSGIFTLDFTFAEPSLVCAMLAIGLRRAVQAMGSDERRADLLQQKETHMGKVLSITE